MSIFFIFSIACMTRLARRGSGSCSISPRMVGFTCHQTPKRSRSQPHGPSSPPADSFSQYSSTSAWVSQSTDNEMPSVNLKCEPPLSAVNGWPFSSKSIVITLPCAPGPDSP